MARMSTQACTMGKSWLRMPVVSICPMPGIVKMFSMMTAPLMTQGIDMKNMIVTRMRALRSTCFTSTLRLCSPLA